MSYSKNGKLVIDASVVEVMDVIDPRIYGFVADSGIFGSSTDDRLWVKIGSGDTDWEEVLVSIDGEFAANIKLSAVNDTVPDVGVLGTNAGKVFLGDGVTTGGTEVGYQYSNDKTNPNRYVSFRIASIDDVNVTVAYVNTSFFNAESTGIIYKIGNADAVYTAVSEGADFTFQIPHQTLAQPIICYVWSGDATGRPFGEISKFESDRSVSMLGCAGNGSISEISLCTISDYFEGRNSAVGLDLSYLPALTDLYISEFSLQYLNLKGSTNLENIELSLGNTDRIDLSECTSLKNIYFSCDTDRNRSVKNIMLPYSNPELEILRYYHTDIPEISLINCPKLVGVSILSYSVESIYLENLADSAWIYINGCTSLTSLLAPGCDFSGDEGIGSYGGVGITVKYGKLSLEALVALHDSVAVTTTGSIRYAGNPGAAEFTALINTPGFDDKGYILIG